VVFKDDLAPATAHFLVEGVFGEVGGPDIVDVDFCTLES